MKPAGSNLILQAPGGAEVAEGTLLAGDETRRRMSIEDLPELEPGSYTVIWNTVALDNDAATGSWTFTVEAPASPSPSPSAAPTAAARYPEARSAILLMSLPQRAAAVGSPIGIRLSRRQPGRPMERFRSSSERIRPVPVGCCVVDPKEYCLSSDLYLTFCEWADERHIRNVPSDIEPGKFLNGRGIEKKSKKSTAGSGNHVGISIREDWRVLIR